MNISSANQMSGVMSTSQANQSNQDSHEKNIQNQIVNLQGKMRDLAYNTEMSTDEKSDKKKKLQEQIQNLNSELKQYKIQKRREEAEKRQKEAEKSDESTKSSSFSKSSVNETSVSNTSDFSDNSNSAAADSGIGNTVSSRDVDSQMPAEESEFGLNGAESEMMVSFSNAQKQLSNMEKIQTNLTGLMRTAETDEEKLKLQKKIDSVSNIIEDKAQKTANKLEESREEDKKKKEKIRQMLKEQEARRANMKAAVPKSGKRLFGYNEDGKVLLTRKKA
ncbi:MAG: FlxA-like family protein [Lachnospiraceae bacterium]|nr:FlxA-like family protein [Lachnospiraceae bacterium]